VATFTDTTAALAAIQAHPLYGSMITTTGRYVVYYKGYTMPGGGTTVRNGNDLASLTNLYNQMVAFASKVGITSPAT
jgi:hypothetical protein